MGLSALLLPAALAVTAYVVKAQVDADASDASSGGDLVADVPGSSSDGSTGGDLAADGGVTPVADTGDQDASAAEGGASTGGDLIPDTSGTADAGVSTGGDLYPDAGAGLASSFDANTTPTATGGDLLSGGDSLGNDPLQSVSDAGTATGGDLVASDPGSSALAYADSSMPSTGGDLYAQNAPPQTYASTFPATATGGDLYAQGKPTPAPKPTFTPISTVASPPPPPKWPKVTWPKQAAAAAAPAPQARYSAPSPAAQASQKPAPPRTVAQAAAPAPAAPPKKEPQTILPQPGIQEPVAPAPETHVPAQRPLPPKASYGVDCQISIKAGKNGAATLVWRSTPTATSGYIWPDVGNVNPTKGSATVYPKNGQQYSMTARGAGGAATCETWPLDTVQVAIPDSKMAGARTASAAAPQQTTIVESPTTVTNYATEPATVYTQPAVAAPTPPVTRVVNGREVPVPSTPAPQVQLTQIPYTGIDSDIAMPFLGFAVMILIATLICIGIYLLNRRDAMPVWG